MLPIVRLLRAKAVNQYRTDQNLAKSAHSRSDQYSFRGTNTVVLTTLMFSNGCPMELLTLVCCIPGTPPPKYCPPTESLPTLTPRHRTEPPHSRSLGLGQTASLSLGKLCYLVGHFTLCKSQTPTAKYYSVLLRLKVTGPKRKSDYSRTLLPAIWRTLYGEPADP